MVRKYVSTATPLNSNEPRFISAPIKRQLFKAAGGQCQAPGCQSTYALEIDHKTSVAHGGTNHSSTLQVLSVGITMLQKDQDRLAR